MPFRLLGAIPGEMTADLEEARLEGRVVKYVDHAGSLPC